MEKKQDRKRKALTTTTTKPKRVRSTSQLKISQPKEEAIKTELSVHQQETYAAFARLKQKTQELYPDQIPPSNDNFKDALQLLSADDRYTIFDAYVNNREYKNALFISNTMEEYFPAYLVLRSTEYFTNSLEEMNLLPPTVPINRECLIETMRHAHMMKSEYYDKRLQKSLIQTFNSAIADESHILSFDLSKHIMFRYQPASLVYNAYSCTNNRKPYFRRQTLPNALNAQHLDNTVIILYEKNKTGEELLSPSLTEISDTTQNLLQDTFNHAIDARNYAIALDLATLYLLDYRPECIKPQLEPNKDWYNQLFREKLQQYIEYDANIR